MLIYLASPYSHPDAELRQARYEAACFAAARLMLKGHVVYSPIAHSHPISDHLPQETLMDHEFWMRQCLPIVKQCDELWVLEIEGSTESKGIRAEMKHALEYLIPIRFVKPESL